MNDEQIREYLRGLKPDERVIETGQSGMRGRVGTVYHKEGRGVCVMWDALPGETGRMGTSATWGTRRIADVLEAYKNKIGDN